MRTRIKIKGVLVHATVNVDRLIDACERQMNSMDNPGFCIMCGLEHDGCDPDMCDGHCEGCGANCVYGAEELVTRMA